MPRGAKEEPTPTEATVEGPRLPYGRDRKRAFKPRRKIDKNSIGAKYHKKRGPAPDPESGRQKRLNTPTSKRTDPKAPQLVKRKKTKAEKAAAKKKYAATFEEIERLRKRNLIMELKEKDWTIRQISDHLKEQGETGVSQSSVFKHLNDALADLVENYTLNAKSLAQLRLNQMHRVHTMHYRRLCEATDVDSIEKLTRAMGRIWTRMDALIDKLQGTEKRSTTVEISSDSAGAVEAKIRVIMPAAPAEEEGDQDGQGDME